MNIHGHELKAKDVKFIEALNNAEIEAFNELDKDAFKDFLIKTNPERKIILTDIVDNKRDKKNAEKEKKRDAEKSLIYLTEMDKVCKKASLDPDLLNDIQLDIIHMKLGDDITEKDISMFRKLGKETTVRGMFHKAAKHANYVDLQTEAKNQRIRKNNWKKDTDTVVKPHIEKIQDGLKQVLMAFKSQIDCYPVDGKPSFNFPMLQAVTPDNNLGLKINISIIDKEARLQANVDKVVKIVKKDVKVLNI